MLRKRANTEKMNKQKTNYFCNQWQCMHQCTHAWMSWHASQTGSWVLLCVSVPSAHGPCSNSQWEIWLSSLGLASGLGNVESLWIEMIFHCQLSYSSEWSPSHALNSFLFSFWHQWLICRDCRRLSCHYDGRLGYGKVLGPMPTTPGEVGVIGTSHFDRSHFDTWIGLVNCCQL